MCINFKTGVRRVVKISWMIQSVRELFLKNISPIKNAYYQGDDQALKLV